MRAILFVLLFSQQALAQNASINIFIATKGEWETAENWSLAQTPSSGDIVIVPSPATVTINKSVHLESLDITVSGQLVLQDAALILEKSGRLIIAGTGSLKGVNNSDEEQVKIGKQIKYIASKDAEINGFAITDTHTGESPEGFDTKTYRMPNIFYGDKNEESWSNPDKWSLGRLPGEGDAVLVPAKTKAIIEEEQKLEDVAITIAGELLLRKAGLTLGETSSLIVDKEGSLNSESASETENVIIGGVIKFEGQKEKSIVGLAMADRLTGASPNGFSQDAILPVILQSFSGRRVDKRINLEWTTGGDETAMRFDIQLQNLNRSWSTIGTVPGAVSSKYMFSFQNDQRHISYCRLAIVNKDNYSEYSRILAIDNQNKKFPVSINNISPGNIQVNLPAGTIGQTQVKIIDLQGKVLKIVNVMPGQTIVKCSLSQRGVVAVQVIANDFHVSRLCYNR